MCFTLPLSISRFPPSEKLVLSNAPGRSFAIVAYMKSTTNKTGIVLMNTGVPASPDPRDIRPYLVEFLSNKNIVRLPHAIWLPVLHGIIARTRPKKTAPRYRSIWTEEGAPLLVETYKQRDALNARFAEEDLPFIAEVGMQYGRPSIEDALRSLHEAGCDRVVAFPLFPQTATCTVGSCKERFLEVLSQPEFRTLFAPSDPEESSCVIEGYSDNPLYWTAIAHSISDIWEWQPGSKLLFSLHSIPLNDVEAGDTYIEEAQHALSQVATLLGVPADDWAIAYHSRFEDSRAWAAPHPKTVLTQWADEGVTRVVLITPGFASDCLESLYDIANVMKVYFEQICQNRGTEADVTYVPALNSRTDHIDLLLDIIKKHCIPL